MLPLPDTSVFTRSELRRCGWSDSAITRAARAGRLQSVRHGYLTGCDQNAPGSWIPPEVAAAAAADACGGGVISHRSALLLHGLPIVGPLPAVPEITVAPRQLGGLTAAHLFRATLREEDITVVNGAPVTSIARTLVDVGRHRPLACAVAALDAALHAQIVECGQIDDVALACWNWPRIRRALRAIRLADPRAESPLESVSRLGLRRLDIPAPTLQAPMFDDFDRFCGRTDFYWDDFGVVGEADGRSKYDDREILVMEKERQERLEELGLIVVRWGWADATRRLPVLNARLNRAFERGAQRDRSGFRRRWSVGTA